MTSQPNPSTDKAKMDKGSQTVRSVPHRPLVVVHLPVAQFEHLGHALGLEHLFLQRGHLLCGFSPVSTSVAFLLACTRKFVYVCVNKDAAHGCEPLSPRPSPQQRGKELCKWVCVREQGRCARL
jgi:hypothetical protein